MRNKQYFFKHAIVFIKGIKIYKRISEEKEIAVIRASKKTNSMVLFFITENDIQYWCNLKQNISGNPLFYFNWIGGILLFPFLLKKSFK